MSFLIDTCCISELTRKRPDPNVVRWFSNNDETSMYLSVLTIGELRKGIEKLEDSRKKIELNRWVSDELTDRFRNRILDIHLDVSNRWGEILAQAEIDGCPLPAIDSLIAATASVHDLAIVTANTKDFKHTGVKLINPWE